MAGKTFEVAGKAIQQRVAKALKTWHSRLMPPLDPDKPSGDKYEPKIDTLLAYGPRNKFGVVTGPALVVRGCRAAACVRVTTLEERILGRGDAVIKIDGDHYKDWAPPVLDAIIDHELTHLEIVLNRAMDPDFDDAGRLRLRLRPHDFEVGWFEEVAERHGKYSAEAIQAKHLTTKQMYFPGFEFLDRSAGAA